MHETPVHSWIRKIPWRMDRLHSLVFVGFLVARNANSACNVGNRIQSLGWEDPLPEVPAGYVTMGSQRART